MKAADSDSGTEVVIARIVKARGIRGEVAGMLETDFPQRFETLEAVTVWMPDDSRRQLTIEDHWFHQGRVILKFAGFDTMDAARTLVGGRLVVPADASFELEDDEFYEYDIVGSEVVTTAGTAVGQVQRLIRTGGTDVLVVIDPGGVEKLIPFADEICTTVDVEAKRIVVDPPAGLLEL